MVDDVTLNGLSSPAHPIEPTTFIPGGSGGSGTSSYEGAYSGQWFITPIGGVGGLGGGELIFTSDSLFTSLALPVELDLAALGLDGLFLSGIDGLGGEFGPISLGTSFDFSGFAGGGVSSFRLSGFGGSGFGSFPLQLLFDGSQADFTIQPSPVPEPTTLVLAVSGFVVCCLFRRSRVR